MTQLADLPDEVDPARESRAAAYRRLHADARGLLTSWTAPTAAQDGRRAELLDHLDGHPDAMDKHGPAAHFTASALVLDDQGQRVLLTLHRRARQWYQFGGHLEPADACVYAAATREAREESGIADLRLHGELVAVDRHTLVGDFGRCREHLDLRFAAVADVGAQPVVSAESLDVRWWPVDDLPAGTRHELALLVRAARTALGVG